MEYTKGKCPLCGDSLTMMVGDTPIEVSLDVWNDNNPITDMKRKDGKILPNCNMCGKVLKTKIAKRRD